ncbi:anti-sigma regulatory factor [Bdellovibrio sp. SKB1291214]|uniref:anti-sigma regulatory factor n=1 Tax=Bdellovibrio sp. SKB1291214 TaxID=1732569 RepID=UPI000B518B40|nr:anti-sigma regulatory factor [Bdellovibrio sp. SKB1291214]UYL07422.1 anti-sigma regulatory factor [Bdellovibrio sp. SKB1291214]
MQILKHEVYPIKTPSDIVIIRKEVRSWSASIGLNLIDQTKVVTAASELARNTLDYGGGGELQLSSVMNVDRKSGIRLVFADQGPGIADLKLALTDGYTTGGGLGLGLSGSRRLVNEFDIESEPGKGTRVTAVKWK